MDQLRTILAVVKRHHFWMLTGAGAGLIVACWMLAAQGIKTDFTKNKAAIEGKANGLKAIQQNAAHPSAAWAPEVAKLTASLTKDVTQAWAVVYQRQKDLLGWPEELGEEFAAAIQDVKDKQTASADGTVPEIDARFREDYQHVFAGHMGTNIGQTLAKMIDARKDESELLATTAVSSPADLGGKVVWEPSSKLAIESKFSWPLPPTTEEILLAQEDYWVYRALFGIIRDTNAAEGATGRYDAPIKSLLAVSVGADAALLPGVDRGRVTMFGQDASAAAGPYGAGGYPGAGGGSQTGDAAAAPLDTATMTQAELIKMNRYAQASGEPIDAAEAARMHIRMLPVTMSLVVDQRKLPALLAACANAPLPVEVTALRFVTKEDDPSTGVGGGQGGYPGGGNPYGRPPGYGAPYPPRPAQGSVSPRSALRLVAFEYQLAQAPYPRGGYGGSPYGRPGGYGGYGRPGGAGGYGGGYGSSGGAGVLQGDPELTNDDIYVELRGLVHIYNPPDPKALAEPSSGETEEAPTAGDELAAAN